MEDLGAALFNFSLDIGWVRPLAAQAHQQDAVDIGVLPCPDKPQVCAVLLLAVLAAAGVDGDGRDAAAGGNLAGRAVGALNQGQHQHLIADTKSSVCPLIPQKRIHALVPP